MNANSKFIFVKHKPLVINDLYNDDQDVYNKKPHERMRRVKHDKKKIITSKKSEI